MKRTKRTNGKMKSDRRFWTAKERAYLRRWYGRRACADIAAKLDRSNKAVYLEAIAQGVAAKKARWAANDERALRRLNATGWTDTEVAAKLGRDRHCVSLHRKRLGLPSNAYGLRWRERNRAQRRRQLATYGVRNFGELRGKRFREFASQRGWPGLSLRGAQIADLLYERGPHTRREICEALGMPTHDDNQKKQLCCRVPGGMYTAELIRAGVAVALTRKRNMSGKGRNVTEYHIAPGVVRGKPETWRRIAIERCPDWEERKNPCQRAV